MLEVNVIRIVFGSIKKFHKVETTGLNCKFLLEIRKIVDIEVSLVKSLQCQFEVILLSE